MKKPVELYESQWAAIIAKINGGDGGWHLESAIRKLMQQLASTDD